MKKPAALPSEPELNKIKKTAIVAMFSDDDLLDQLVLKGGNAMDLVHHVSSRASVDLDFSMAEDLDIATAEPRVGRSLASAFKDIGYLVFDVKMKAKPRADLPEHLAAFWGGYEVSFKLITPAKAEELKHDVEAMRRNALMLGQGTNFTMDLSRHEYVENKQAADLDGYRIYVYTPEMIVCEKLRAICQQLPEYGEVIQRGGLGKQRARDFIDIEALVTRCGVDVGSESAQHIVSEMFRLKRVPVAYLSKIAESKDLHALGFDQVKSTIRPGIDLQPFEYYFDFVLAQAKKLEPLWNV